MKILWYNWRDILNPAAGGAEVLTHEVMKRLVAKGYDMTLFTSRFSNSKRNEIVDGVDIIREGGKYLVYSKAKDYYNANGSKFDLVIDEINTRPFLTPKFVRDTPILALFHQLAREFWFYETFFPLNYLGYYYLERKWLSYYREVPTITISESSRQDLESFGFKKIFVAPEGLNVAPLDQVSQKESVPTIAFIGRLKKAKLPHHAVQAFLLLKKEVPDAKMWVIGDGYMRNYLEKMAVKDITFYGRVDNNLKFELLRKAHLILVPAIREGWGLIVTEANAMGTPAIGYDVSGLRDSIINGETGILVSYNNPDSLAYAAGALLNERLRLEELSSNALKFSRQFNWDNTANAFATIINQICRN